MNRQGEQMCGSVVKDSLTIEPVRNPYNISDKMGEAGWRAYNQYQLWIKEKRFPRPSLVAHIYASMRDSE